MSKSSASAVYPGPQTHVFAEVQILCYALMVTGLLEDALRKVAALSGEDQDAIASQILETLEDEAAWKQKLAATRPKLRALADAATREHQEGKTKPLDETL